MSRLRHEAVKVSAFFAKGWWMTRRNALTVFEVAFWPVVSLLSVGLLTRFVDLQPATTLFVLVGTVAFSVVQVCQLDVAYALLFDVWGKSVKHQFLAPIHAWHLVLGALLVGVVRSLLAFGLVTGVAYAAFGVSLLAPGWVATGAFLAGLLLSAAPVGLLVATLLLLVGVHAEVTAWSGVSILLLLCGIYYPVSVLPAPFATVAQAIPLTHVLEAFRAELGFPSGGGQPLVLGFGLGLAYLFGAHLAFRWALSRARRTGMLLRLSA